MRVYDLGSWVLGACWVAACGSRTLDESADPTGAGQGSSPGTGGTPAGPADGGASSVGPTSTVRLPPGDSPRFETTCSLAVTADSVPGSVYQGGVPAATGTTGSTLTIVSATSTAGYIVHRPGDLTSDPRAQSPSYLYLALGVDAVGLVGPAFTAFSAADLSALLAFDHPTAVGYATSPGFGEGIRFTVNGRLHFDLDIDDFEDEVALGWVELTRVGATVQTLFVLLGQGDGVAHNVRNTIYIDGAPGCTTSGVTIEVR